MKVEDVKLVFHLVDKFSNFVAQFVPWSSLQIQGKVCRWIEFVAKNHRRLRSMVRRPQGYGRTGNLTIGTGGLISGLGAFSIARRNIFLDRNSSASPWSYQIACEIRV